MSTSAIARIVSLAVTLAATTVIAVFHGTVAAFLGSTPEGRVGTTIAQVAGTLAWLTAGFLVNRLVNDIVWRGFAAAALGRPVPAILRTLTSLCVHLAAMSCVVAFVFNHSVAAFLAALGAGGVVLGLALRGMMEDLFAGIAVNLDRVIGIGDWIRLAGGRDGEILGRVRDIGWRCTQLETEDGMLLLVPNGVLGREVVTNLSRPAEPTRQECTIVLDRGVPLERARRILAGALEAARADRGFVADGRSAVLAGEPNERGIPYVLRYWILPWNPLSPTTARDRIVSRVCHDLEVAGIAPAIEKSELSFARRGAAAPAEQSADGRLRVLDRVHLFTGLEPADRERLAAAIRPVELPAGRTLFEQDDTGDTLYVVAEGAVDVLVRSAGGGAPTRVATLGVGDFFGEMSLLTGEPRRATVRAASGCLLYELTRDTVGELVAARPSVSDVLSHTLAVRRAALEASGDARPDAVVVEHGRRSILQKMLTILGQRPAEASRSGVA